MKIGIFDSGMGGLSVLAMARKLLPHDDFIYYGDTKYAPYGTQSVSYVVDRCKQICDYLLSENVDAIVIACNTATSAAVNILRRSYKIPIIGMEPAIKPAIEENHGKGIVVMATPMTLKETKYKNLLNRVRTTQSVYEIPAPKVVELVEAGKSDSMEMTLVLQEYFKEVPMENVESIVLGCTHFLFIKNQLKKLYPHVKLIDGNRGTIDQLIRKLPKEINIEHDQKIVIMNSAGIDFVDQSKKLLEEYEATYGNQ